MTEDLTRLVIRNLEYQYFGGHRTRKLAREQAKTLRGRGHLVVVIPTPSLYFPWTTYWHSLSSRRQHPKLLE